MDAPNDWDEWAPAVALLREAQALFVDVVFAPDVDSDGEENGRTISALIRGFPELQTDNYFPGIQLSSTYDLSTACSAAMKPLAEVRNQIDECIKREEEK